MPRYFFDTQIKSSVFQDAEGAEFETDDLAIRQAMQDAKMFGADRLAHGGVIAKSRSSAPKAAISLPGLRSRKPFVS